jgi:hypothetical protein
MYEQRTGKSSKSAYKLDIEQEVNQLIASDFVELA